MRKYLHLYFILCCSLILTGSAYALTLPVPFFFKNAKLKTTAQIKPAVKKIALKKIRVNSVFDRLLQEYQTERAFQQSS